MPSRFLCSNHFLALSVVSYPVLFYLCVQAAPGDRKDFSQSTVSFAPRKNFLLPFFLLIFGPPTASPDLNLPDGFTHKI